MTLPNNTADNNLVIKMNIKRTRILVADDDPVYREVAKEALETAGHAVTVAADGAEAIAAMAAMQFDTAVIDLNMPKADGIAVIEAARAKGEPTVPSLLSLELATNPFLRAGLAPVKQSIGMPDASDAESFAEIRRRKDHF